MKYSLLTLALVALLVAVPVQAAQITPTLSYDNTDLTTGTTRTITVTVAGSGSAATISSLTLSTSCLTVSDPSGGSYNSFSAATGGTSKNFVVTSGTAGTCTFSASSLEQGETSPATSSEGTLVFVNPSSVGTTIDADPTGTYSSGANYTLTATLSNPLNSTVEVGYNITSGAGTTKQTGDAENDTLTLTAGAETQLNWSYASTATDTIYLYVGDNLAHSAVITISSSSSSSNTSTSTGGGGGGSSTASSTTPIVTYVITSVAAGSSIHKTPSKDGLPITDITVKVKEAASNVILQLKGLSAKPSDISTPAATYTPYQYVEINTENLNNTNIDEATITFTVNNSWITSNNIETVSLLRYHTNQWENYTASLVTSGINQKTYTATVPGFSAFAIVGEQASTPPVTGGNTTINNGNTGNRNTTIPLEEHNTTTQPPLVPSNTPILFWIIVGIVIVVVIIGAVVLYAGNKPTLHR